tara:strand:- start:5630 stop:6028 length:399 start_codon:yes stop_codon:yes gene_type:complete
MYKFFLFFFICIFFNSNIYAQDSTLTLKQQLDKLQREINDLSESIYNSKKINNINNVDLASFDLRLYDLEKDIQILNNSLEELYFFLEDINTKLTKLKVSENYESHINELILKNRLLEERLLKIEGIIEILN